MGRIRELELSEEGSSRTIHLKSIYRDGVGFTLMTQSDSLTKPSSFVSNFFQTFHPVDTLKGINPFEKKSERFFKDLMSRDTVIQKRALKMVDVIHVDSTDLHLIKKTIDWLTWDKRKYLEIKKSLISKLDNIPTRGASDYLKELYYNAGDTVELQYTVLETLLQQQTQYAFYVFRDIITTEPPVIGKNARNKVWTIYPPLSGRSRNASGYDDQDFIEELRDSLKLTSSILPDLLPLVNLEDYKSPIMGLLAMMIDSNLAHPRDYDIYFSKFLIEAKQELKRQAINEKMKSIKKAEQKKEGENLGALDMIPDNEDEGNQDLHLYATLLLPYWDINPNVHPVIRQMLNSSDKRLKYNTMMLMLRKNKPIPDSLTRYFAGLDEFRYELYADLKELGKEDKFPAIYNNHLDLGRSCLLDRSAYSKPDTIAYIDRLPAEVKGKKGFVYFYKYKSKKDDITWKLATVGLVPEDPAKFEFDQAKNKGSYTSVIPAGILWQPTMKPTSPVCSIPVSGRMNL